MSNIFSELYKGLRSMGFGFKESRQAVFDERKAQRAEDTFGKAFGVSIDELVRRSAEPRIERMVLDILNRHLPTLLPRALPKVLWQLAQDGPLGTGGTEDPGTLVACLSRSNGAYWGVAPDGGGGNRSAFHASLVYDTEEKKYTITMLEGYAQVVGYSQQHVPGAFFSSKEVSWWCWLQWTQSTDSWSLQSANAQPQSMGGDLNVPLWKFTWAADGNGELVQYVEGAILMAMTVNALDVDAAAQDVDSTT